MSLNEKMCTATMGDSSESSEDEMIQVIHSQLDIRSPETLDRPEEYLGIDNQFVPPSPLGAGAEQQRRSPQDAMVRMQDSTADMPVYPNLSIERTPDAQESESPLMTPGPPAEEEELSRVRLGYTICWVQAALKGKVSATLKLGFETLLVAQRTKGEVRDRWVFRSLDGLEIGELIPRERSARFSYNHPDQSQVLGISFFRDRETRHRFFRLAIAQDGYQAVDREGELSRVARAGRPVDRVRMLVSKRPTRTPEGRVVQKFGNVHVIPSVKNFLLEDENGNFLFSVFRTADDACGMQASSSFPPDCVCALALSAILTET